MSRPSTSNAAAFDEAFETLLQGPVGTEVRRAHLLQRYATLVFNGNFQRARWAMDKPLAELGRQSPNEAATTEEGMKSVRQLIDAAASAPAASRMTGLGYFIHTIQEGWREDYEMRVDLLPAAWGLSDEEFAQLLGARPPSMRDWVSGNIEMNPDLQRRAKRLLNLHEAFRLMVDREYYSQIWRQTWERGSPIGVRSPFQAYLEDGDSVLDLLEERFRYLSGTAAQF